MFYEQLGVESNNSSRSENSMSSTIFSSSWLCEDYISWLSFVDYSLETSSFENCVTCFNFNGMLNSFSRHTAVSLVNIRLSPIFDFVLCIASGLKRKVYLCVYIFLTLVNGILYSFNLF